MLRIALCHPQEETLQCLFVLARETLHTLKFRCELSCHKDVSRVTENLAGDKNYYDIWLLDGGDEACLALARRIRSVNLTANLIFWDRDLSRLHTLLCLRPSALLLPEDAEIRLPRVLTDCCNEQLRCLRHFNIKNKDGMMRIPFEDISFVESRQRLAILHTRKKTIEFYAKLSEVMPQLPQDEFVHCHQSYIVNLRKVARLDKANRCFILTDGTPVEISKSNYSDTVARYSALSGA